MPPEQLQAISLVRHPRLVSLPSVWAILTFVYLALQFLAYLGGAVIGSLSGLLSGVVGLFVPFGFISLAQILDVLTGEADSPLGIFGGLLPFITLFSAFIFLDRFLGEREPTERFIWILVILLVITMLTDLMVWGSPFMSFMYLLAAGDPLSGWH